MKADFNRYICEVAIGEIFEAVKSSAQRNYQKAIKL